MGPWVVSTSLVIEVRPKTSSATTSEGLCRDKLVRPWNISNKGRYRKRSTRPKHSRSGLGRSIGFRLCRLRDNRLIQTWTQVKSFTLPRWESVFFSPTLPSRVMSTSTVVIYGSVCPLYTSVEKDKNETNDPSIIKSMSWPIIVYLYYWYCHCFVTDDLRIMNTR